MPVGHKEEEAKIGMESLQTTTQFWYLWKEGRRKDWLEKVVAHSTVQRKFDPGRWVRRLLCSTEWASTSTCTILSQWLLVAWGKHGLDTNMVVDHQVETEAISQLSFL